MKSRRLKALKFLPVLLAIWMWVLSLSAFAESVQIKPINGRDSSNAAITVVTASVRQFINIYGFYLNVATADTVTLKCGSTVMDTFFLADKGGVTFQVTDKKLTTCPSSADLTVNKGTAATDLSYKFWLEQK